MPGVIRVSFGPYSFSSGFNPTEILGPNRALNVVEHAIPAREGGIAEYLGSRSPTYQLKGFLTAVNDTLTGPAGAVLSGTQYVAQSADQAMQFIQGLRGSGANLLTIESTQTTVSGYPVFYENDFFLMTKTTFGMVAGKTYPYYPYDIGFTRAPTKSVGQSSGLTVYGPSTAGPTSGYIFAETWRSGFYNGRGIVALGFNANTVASGSAQMALYNVSGPQGTTMGLVATTASQPINSGWNYFPIRPVILTVASGNFYQLALMTNIVNPSGASYLNLDTSNTSGTSHVATVIYTSGPPDPFIAASGIFSSGIQIDMVLVTV